MTKELVEFYMKEAFHIAQKGDGYVHPNPLVGAIIVKDERIIGQGYHQKFGGAHAEINAFRDTKEDVSGATMFVTLEPCSHHGKTAPCALKIIEKKIKKVYIAILDPNPLVHYQGVRLLKAAGIEVEYGILENIALRQNEAFFKYIQMKKTKEALK